jgi:hypothetical protein
VSAYNLSRQAPEAGTKLEKGGLSMSDSSSERNPEQTNYLAPGLAFGLIFGAALGLVFGIALDNMAFMAIGVGTGLTLALSIGTAMQERHGEDEA